MPDIFGISAYLGKSAEDKTSRLLHFAGYILVKFVSEVLETKVSLELPP